jgi:hypothetical protein
LRGDQPRSGEEERPGSLLADVVVEHTRTYHDHRQGGVSNASDVRHSRFNQHSDQQPATIAKACTIDRIPGLATAMEDNCTNDVRLGRAILSDAKTSLLVSW